MKKAVIYARYSSDRQTEQSIEGQLRTCHEYAKRNKIIIIDEYIDRATTGTNDHRPAFQKLMHDCHNSFWDYVIVYKLDRFSRNKYEMITHRKTLKDNNIKLLSATEGISDSAEGILLESLLEGMAEYYSVDLSQKTKRGLNESRQKNQFTGGRILYGYSVKDKKVYVNEDEAKVIRHIYEQHLSGKFINEIVKDLTEKGIYYRGKPFKENTIYKFLKNEKYIGIFRHEDEVFTNTYPAIISKNMFDAVREKMNSNHYGKHKKDVKYLLKDKLVCGCCGGKIQSGSGTNKDGSIRRYYNCATRIKFKTCKKEHIKKELLEQIVIDTTFKIFEDKENLEILSNKIVEIHNSKVEDVAFLNLLERERQSTKLSLDNLINGIALGIITKTTKARLTELETKLAELNEKITIENAKYKTPITKEDVIEFITTSLKKDAGYLINVLIKNIILYDDKIEIYYNYTNKTDTLDSIQECPFYSGKIEKEIKNTKINGENYTLSFYIEGYM